MTDREANPGVQAERTLLAWWRTCLALTVGCLIWIRVLSADLGAFAVVLGILGVVTVAAAWALPYRRYGAWKGRMAEDPTGFRIGGAPLAALTVATVTLGALGLLAALRL